MRQNGIENITIQNFKAFREAKTFTINRKHVLVYGPNGSGKSSLYFSLYTLFQCAVKTVEDIKKYFNESDENLLNIYEPGIPSYIEVKTNTNGDEIIFKLDINGIAGDTKNLKILNQASEFISHRLLLNFYNFRNSKEINLLNIFEKDILPFVYGENNFKEIELSTALKNIENRLKLIGLRYWRKKQKLEEGSLNDFNNEIGLLVNYINENATNFLNNNFKNNDIKILLTLKGKYRVAKGNKNYYIVPPFYKLSVEQKLPGGITKSIDRPHTFLNESRLTRIGIAIRFCLLPKRLQNVPLKILALDDMLISMDMDNRLEVIEIIFKLFENDYQLFLFTHDKGFFREIKRKIEDKISEWVLYEFKYLNDNKVNYFSAKTEIEKARTFLENSEFESCALELRKLGEIIFRNFVDKKKPEIFRTKDYVPFGKMIEEAKNVIIQSILSKFQKSILELDLSPEDIRAISQDDITSFKTNPAIEPALKTKIISARKTLFELLEKANIENKEALKFINEVHKIKDRILNYGAHPSDETLFKTEMEEAVKLFGELQTVLDKV